MRVTPKEAKEVVLRKVRVLDFAIRKAEEDGARYAVFIGEKFSQGPYSSKTLHEMGHPYAKRRPRPPADASIINRQTGKFLSSWRKSKPAVKSGRLVTRIWNEAPYATFLDTGTKLMIRRPIAKRIRLEVYKKRRKALNAALKAGMSAT